MEEQKFEEPAATQGGLLATPSEKSAAFSQHVKMGTRRKPTDIGRHPTVIVNRQSNESSLDRSQYRV